MPGAVGTIDEPGSGWTAMDGRTALTGAEAGVESRAAGVETPAVGKWLVEPGPPCTRMWRWGRISGVLPDGQHLLVRWYGDRHDTFVLPTGYARIESAEHQPQTAGDAVGCSRRPDVTDLDFEVVRGAVVSAEPASAPRVAPT